METDEDYFNEDENLGDENKGVEMQAGIKDFERVGIGNISACDLYIDKKQNKKFLSQIENFCKNVNAIIIDIINNSNPQILYNFDLQNIIENIKNLNTPEYKNPTAYILGYYIAEGSEISLNQERLRRVFKMLNHSEFTDENTYIVSDKSVLEPDIIRYARLWINIKHLQS